MAGIITKQAFLKNLFKNFQKPKTGPEPELGYVMEHPYATHLDNLSKVEFVMHVEEKHPHLSKYTENISWQHIPTKHQKELTAAYKNWDGKPYLQKKAFWVGFEKRAIKIQHSLSPEAETQVMKMINHAHEKLQSVINQDLKKTLHESISHIGEAKKFRARDVFIPAISAGFGVGVGHMLGKKTGQKITNERPAQS